MTMSTKHTMHAKRRPVKKGQRSPELARLVQEERALSKALEKIQGKISKCVGGEMSEKEFEKLLDDLSAGLPDLPSLPADFSRADLYDDHD